MKKINLKVRFNRKNMTFIFRFIGSLLVPVLAYFGLNFEDLNSWNAAWTVLKDFLSNPYLIGLTIFNGLNTIPDGTTKGLRDSARAVGYKEPAK